VSVFGLGSDASGLEMERVGRRFRSCIGIPGIAAVFLVLVSSALQWHQVYAQQPGGLVVGYYQNNGLCDADVEGIVTSTVQQAMQSDPTVPAGLLRLLFHDCWVEVIAAVMSFLEFVIFSLMTLAIYIKLPANAPHWAG
jgi:hypothetical protein